MTVINAQARAELEAAIDARINSGVKAASYSTDEQAVLSSTMQEGSVVERVAGTGYHLVGCTADGADCACPPQKPDKVSDKACNDAARLRVALAVIASLEADYQPQHRGKTPGIGPCPSGKCEDCWEAGFEVTAAAKRYRNLCRRHGDFRKRNGYPIPVLVTRALKLTDWDWSHWRVRHAQRQAS